MLTHKITQYTVSEISKKLDIPKTTIYRWLRYENIENIVNFMKLLIYLEIDMKEFVDFYEKDIKKRE